MHPSAVPRAQTTKKSTARRSISGERPSSPQRNEAIGLSGAFQKSPSLLRKAARPQSGTTAAISLAGIETDNKASPTKPSATASGSTLPPHSLPPHAILPAEAENVSLSLKEVLRDRLEYDTKERDRRELDPHGPQNSQRKRRNPSNQQDLGHSRTPSLTESVASDTKHGPQSPHQIGEGEISDETNLSPDRQLGDMSYPRPSSSHFGIDDVSSEHISTPFSDSDDQSNRLQLFAIMASLVCLPLTLPLRLLTVIPISRNLVPKILMPTPLALVLHSVILLTLEILGWAAQRTGLRL